MLGRIEAGQGAWAAGEGSCLRGANAYNDINIADLSDFSLKRAVGRADTDDGCGGLE
jgi:hypothetical protein